MDSLLSHVPKEGPGAPKPNILHPRSQRRDQGHPNPTSQTQDPTSQVSETRPGAPKPNIPGLRDETWGTQTQHPTSQVSETRPGAPGQHLTSQVSETRPGPPYIPGLRDETRGTQTQHPTSQVSETRLGAPKLGGGSAPRNDSDTRLRERNRFVNLCTSETQ